MNLLVIFAVVLLAIWLPSFMTRLGMSKAEQIKFVIMAFSVLGIAWLAVYVIGRFI